MTTIQHIDEARRLLDVTQKTLCETAGIAPSTYVRTKKGLTSPNQRTIDRLANALALLQRHAKGAAA